MGASIRLGINLPDDFGIQTIDSLATTSGGRSAQSRRIGAYAFVATEGRLLLYDAFLNSNIFQHSQRVHSELLVGDVIGGFVFYLRCLEIGYIHFARTPVFHGQTEHDSYGAVFLKLKWRPKT